MSARRGCWAFRVMYRNGETLWEIDGLTRRRRPGLICLTLTRERCERLQLPPMATRNGTKHGTAFTVSIEAAEGVTTGISAADRAHTIKTAVDPANGRESIVKGGAKTGASILDGFHALTGAFKKVPWF